jgi:hypothetical protein
MGSVTQPIPVEHIVSSPITITSNVVRHLLRCESAGAL